MKTELEIQLEASILYCKMRSKVEELTARLAEMVNENDLLRAERDLLELKLQRLARRVSA
jgi:regulator of replication initiation timing